MGCLQWVDTLCDVYQNGGMLMRRMVGFLFLFGLTTVLYAQKVERVYPDYDHSALFGVVTTDNGDLYAAGSNSALLRSTDGGSSWEQMPMDDQKVHIHRLVTDGEDLYMLGYAPLFEGHPELWPDGYSSILFRFRTDERKFEKVPFPIFDRQDYSRRYDFRRFDVAATENELYLSYAGSRSRLLRSDDKGATWTDLMLPVSLGMLDPCYFFTRKGSEDILVYLEHDSGETFYLSSDHGNTWKPIGAPFMRERPVVYLGNGQILVHRMDSGYRMYDSTSLWQTLSKPPFSWTSAITVGADGVVFACSGSGGVFRSDDTCKTWVTLRPDFSSFFKERYRYVGTVLGSQGFVAVNQFGNIILTTDGGVSWEEPRYRSAQFTVASMTNKSLGLISTYDNDDDTRPALYTDDAFVTVQPIPDTPLDWVAIRSPTLWYAMAARWYGTGTDSLLCRSTDAGGSWELILDTLDVRTFWTIIEAVHAEEYAVCTSQGLLYTSDSGETWENIFPAEWDYGTYPRKIILHEDGKTTWMLTGADGTGTAYTIVRHDRRSSISDTVLVLPDSLHWSTSSMVGRTYGFEDLSVSKEGHVYATYYMTAEGRNRAELVVSYSADAGVTWQTWTTQTPVPEHWYADNGLGARTQHLSASGMLTSAIQMEFPIILPMAILASTDGYHSADVIFESAVTGNVDRRFYLAGADDHTAYVITGFGIYRVTFPEATNVRSPKPPPLPLSIGTPYPHPVSGRSGAAMLFIQSEHPTRVRMTAHDLAGREVGRLFEGELSLEGRHVSWSAGTLAPGTYVLQLEAGEGVCRRKVVVE